MEIEILNLIKVLLPAVMAFAVGMLITPVVTHYLYKHKAWKKTTKKVALDGMEATEFNRLHRTHDAEDIKTPRMGGIVIWAGAGITVAMMWLLAHIVPDALYLKLDFLSRAQTWIPATALGIGALVGFMSDALEMREGGSGMRLRHRLGIVIALSLFLGWWFWAKLDVVSVGIPFAEPLYLGVWIIPLFVLTSLALYASGVIDGIDGLSGGVFASVFSAYALIAFAQNQLDLAAFSAMLVGAILAFLWFNIPPARFYMTETGTMALTLTLAVVAFMTDTLGEGIGIVVLPIIGALLVLTVLSNILQVLSKKIRGKKLFRVAPLHHHFEALGWSGAKVTMRYWILSIMCAFCGVVIALIGA